VSINSNKPKLVFVFLGMNFPDYAKASLKLVRMTNDVKIVLLANQSVRQQIRNSNIDFVPVEEFYDPSIFDAIRRANLNSSSFRDGFWSKTLERFFVLEQFMKVFSEKSIVHAELDQLLFRVDVLSRNLSDAKFSGLMIPFHSPGIAVASVVFISDASLLTDFVNYSIKQTSFESEMYLLAKWANSSSSKICAAPTFSSFMHSFDYELKIGLPLLELSTTKGFIDPAQVGQWVGGIDPRNVPLRLSPMNKFVDSPRDLLLGKADLSEFVFKFDSDEGFLRVDNHQSTSNRLYNLHLHSKIHRWLLSDLITFKAFFDISNQEVPYSFPGTRRTQISSWIVEMWDVFLSRPIKSIFSLLRKILGKK
jgi:hypothetical protein